MMNREIEISFIFEKGINSSEKFMGSSKNSFLIRQTLFFPSFKIISKNRIVPDYINTHKPYNSSQMSIPSFRNFAFSFKVAGFINSWVKSCISNKLFVRGESFYVLNLSKKVKSSCFTYAFNGEKNVKIFTFTCSFAGLFKKFFNIFKSFLKEKEFLYGSGKDIFFYRPVLSYRIFSKCFYIFSRNRRLSSFLRRKDVFNFFKRGLFNSIGRREFFKEFKDRGIIDVSGSFKFREGYNNKFFYIIFPFSNFLSDSFSFSGKVFKFFGEKGLRRKFLVELREKSCNSFGINGIGFSFSERKFSEVFNKYGVKDYTDKVVVNKIGDEIEMIAAGRFNTDEDGFFGNMRKCFSKGFYTLVIKGEGLREEDILGGINKAGMKGVFRDINANKVGNHRSSSFCGFLVRQGACFPILQLDKGLIAQPTYNGLSRQATNSLEGLSAQKKWSCPALLPFSCFYYTSYVNKSLVNNITNFS